MTQERRVQNFDKEPLIVKWNTTSAGRIVLFSQLRTFGHRMRPFHRFLFSILPNSRRDGRDPPR